MADNNDVNFKVYKEAGKVIGQGLQTIDNQVGLDANYSRSCNSCR